MHPDSSPATQNAGPHRRSVLRSAAWSLPAVGLAAASPAFAASTRQLRIQLTTPAQWNDSSSIDEYMAISLTVTNLSPTTAAGALSFYLRFSNVFFGAVVTGMDFDTAGGSTGGTGANAYGNGWTKATNTSTGTGTSRTGGATFTLAGLGAGQTSAILGLRAKSARFVLTDPTGNRDPVLIQSITPPNSFTMAPASITSFNPVGP